jgi:hypothetical protein
MSTTARLDSLGRPINVDHLRSIAALGGRAKKPRKKPKRTTWGECCLCGSPRPARKTKTCGKACANQLRSNAWSKEKVPNKTCCQCGGRYHHYNKNNRYCSYSCHLKSGGALRAGLAAAGARVKYGAKKDANHIAIVQVMKQCGVPVYDLSGAGNGVPDCIAWVKNEWRLVEIKNPKTGYGRRGLNPIQQKWIDQWRGGPVFILKSVDDALAFTGGKFEAVEMIRPLGCNQ